MTNAVRPIRIQRRRAKGWRMPENTVYVGRPTKWGNLWSVGVVACGCRSAGECSHNLFRAENAQEAVGLYRMWIGGALRRQATGRTREELEELRGKNLACWCPLDAPCHADVLLELANRERP